MSLVNAKEINAVAINADSGSIKDAAMLLSCSSSGVLLETRVVPSSIALTTHSDGSIDRPALIVNPNMSFLCQASGKLKLVIPINLAVTFDTSSDLQLNAAEVFNLGLNFEAESAGSIGRFAIYRKANPGIVFTLHSLQYRNSGRIRINKNKYL